MVKFRHANSANASHYQILAERATIVTMNCRPLCAACCIAPSISSPIPGMPHGKAAGQRCVQLDEQERCRLFGRPERPQICQSLMPTPQMCGQHREHAMHWLTQLEADTAPR
jgi:uncharacterized protein